jgi:hypothetical protein
VVIDLATRGGDVARYVYHCYDNMSTLHGESIVGAAKGCYSERWPYKLRAADGIDVSALDRDAISCHRSFIGRTSVLRVPLAELQSAIIGASKGGSRSCKGWLPVLRVPLVELQYPIIKASKGRSWGYKCKPAASERP